MPLRAHDFAAVAVTAAVCWYLQWAGQRAAAKLCSAVPAVRYYLVTKNDVEVVVVVGRTVMREWERDIVALPH